MKTMQAVQTLADTDPYQQEEIYLVTTKAIEIATQKLTLKMM